MSTPLSSATFRKIYKTKDIISCRGQIPLMRPAQADRKCPAQTEINSVTSSSVVSDTP